MRKKKELYRQGITETTPSAQPQQIDSESAKNDYLSILYYQKKLRDNLLGDFSVDGKYAIKDEKILQELVNIPKKFDEKKDDTVYASTKIEDDVVLNFKIEFSISESFCSATLFIIEIENTPEDDIKHTTKLDEYMDIYSPKFKEEMYKRWKVYFDENTYDKNDYLYTLLHMQRQELLFNRELTEILAQLYMVRMLALLDNSGELGEKLKAEYKLLIEKILQTDPSIMQDNTRQKQILDYIFLKNNAFGKILGNKEAPAILMNYSAPLKRIKDKTTTIVEIEKNKQDKKIEEPTKANTPAKKPSAKKKGGGKLGKDSGGKDKGGSKGGGGKKPNKGKSGGFGDPIKKPEQPKVVGKPELKGKNEKEKNKGQQNQPHELTDEEKKLIDEFRLNSENLTKEIDSLNENLSENIAKETDNLNKNLSENIAKETDNLNYDNKEQERERKNIIYGDANQTEEMSSPPGRATIDDEPERTL